MISIDVSLVVGVLTILSIAIGAVVFMVRLWNNVDNTMVKHTIVLDSLVSEVKDIKSFEPRITKNETDIKLIKQQCEFYHEGVGKNAK